MVWKCTLLILKPNCIIFLWAPTIFLIKKFTPSIELVEFTPRFSFMKFMMLINSYSFSPIESISGSISEIIKLSKKSSLIVAISMCDFVPKLCKFWILDFNFFIILVMSLCFLSFRNYNPLNPNIE